MNEKTMQQNTHGLSRRKLLVVGSAAGAGGFLFGQILGCRLPSSGEEKREGITFPLSYHKLDTDVARVRAYKAYYRWRS